MSGVDEVVEQGERITPRSHDEGMGPMGQRCVMEHELVVQDGAARIGRASECTDVLSIDGKRYVGGGDGARHRVREYVEHVHCGSDEVYGYRCRGLRGEMSGIVPGLPVNLGEV